MLYYVFVSINYCIFKQHINLRVNNNMFTTLIVFKDQVSSLK